MQAGSVHEEYEQQPTAHVEHSPSKLPSKLPSELILDGNRFKRLAAERLIRRAATILSRLEGDERLVGWMLEDCADALVDSRYRYPSAS